MKIGRRIKSGIILAIAIVMIMAFPLVGNAAESYKEWTSSDSLPQSGTYKLMNDVTVETAFGKYAADISKELVLDLNGHTVTIDGGASSGINVRKTGSLTIEDSVGGGKMVNTVDGPDTLVFVNGGKFIMNSGTVENIVKSGLTMQINSGGKAKLNGGTLLNTSDGGRPLFINSDDSAVVLDGATIENKAKNENAIFINGGNQDIGASFEMLSGTVKCATTYASKAAIYANNGANSIKISGGTIESATVGVYAAFTPVTVTGGTIDAAGHAFQTRYTEIEPAEGSEVIVNSDKSLFYTFSDSDNKVNGGSFEVGGIESAYTSTPPSVTTVEAGTFNVDPAKYVTNPDKGVIGDGNEIFVVGAEDELNEALKEMIEEGATTIEITKGNVALNVETDGITFTNKGGGAVTVNGQEIGKTPVEVHVHSAVKTEAKEATCTEDGNIEYWYCENCDKYFEDAALTKEITEDKTIIKTNGHNYDDRGKCIVCGAVTADRAEADEVDKLIDAIGPADKVTLDSKDAIMAAKKAYNALTDEQKKLVTGLDDLNAAIDAYNALLADGKNPIDKPASSDKDNESNGVKTDDTTALGLLAVMLMLSGAGIAALRRKPQ